MVEDYQHGISYDDGNKAERYFTKKINNELLGSSSLFSLMIRPLSNSVSKESKIKMKNLVNEINTTHLNWGFKDPRTCFTYDDWSDVAPSHKVLVVFRSPKEVWVHYWNNARSIRKKVLTIRYFFHSWCLHNQYILNYLSETKNDYLVLDYSRFMNDDTDFQKLEEFLGISLVDERRKELHRSISAGSFGFNLSKFVHKLKGGDNPDKILKKLQAYL